MTDEWIIQEAKKAEKGTAFSYLVHGSKSRGVNSAYGIGFIDGMVKYRESLWHDAQGDNIPEIGREVIALIQDCKGMYKVVFAHRPNPDGWDGKSLSTGEVEHYEPKNYDKGGWNMPDVKYWLDIDLPKEVMEESV